MADNVSVTPGSGVIIATRDAGSGVEVQRVIPNTWNGTTATDVSSSNPLPVNVLGDPEVQVQGAVAIGAAASGENPVLQGISDGINVQVRTGNVDNIVVHALAAHTTTQTSSDHNNNNHRGAFFVLVVTSAGTGSITLSVQGKDPVSGNYFTLLTGAAVTTNSTNLYTVYPGATVAANAAVSIPVPHTWRVVVTANNANTITYSVGASMLL